MFRKKPDYGDLCEILNVINHTQCVQNETNEEFINQIHALSMDIKRKTERIEKLEHNIMDLKERINYTLQKVLDLTDRVEALEAKKQHKTTKKQTKKTKGK